MEKETPRRKNWKLGGIWVGLTSEENVMVLGFGTMWDGNEQRAGRPGDKNEIEEDVEVDSTGGKREEQMSGGEQWSCI